MKILVPLSLLLMLAMTGQAQSNISANVMGFGEIGVVASGNNYQSAYAQNPALLARESHQFDAFANYNQVAQIINVNSVIAGGMLTYRENNAFGIGLNQFRIGTNDVFSITNIPLLYARSLYKTDWAGVSAGVNVNLTNHQGTPFNSMIGTTVNTSNISGGFGVDAYRIFATGDNHFLRFNLGASTNYLGSDMEDNNGYFSPVNDQSQVGTMVSWKYVMNSLESINFNFAYQFRGSFEMVNSLNSHQFGLEGRYSLEERGIYGALRIGSIWDTYISTTEYRYMTFGGTLSIRGFYIDFALLPERLNGFNNVNIGIGYQKLLD